MSGLFDSTNCGRAVPVMGVDQSFALRIASELGGWVMTSVDDENMHVDFAGIQALSSREAGYAVALKCIQVQAHAEDLDPSLRSADRVRLHPDAWSWYTGAVGEIEVGKLLRALGSEWF